MLFLNEFKAHDVSLDEIRQMFLRPIEKHDVTPFSLVFAADGPLVYDFPLCGMTVVGSIVYLPTSRNSLGLFVIRPL